MQKRITTLCSLFIISIIVFSCAKELSNETGTYDFLAKGSITTDSVGNCVGTTVVGTFYNGVRAGSDTAYVSLELNVSRVGKYSISTTDMNGYFFADSGNISATGKQTVRLKQVGIAILPKTDTFFVEFDSSFCQFIVNVQDSTGVDFPDDTSGGSTLTLADSIPENSWTFIDDTLTYSGLVQIAEFNIINELLIFGDYGVAADTSLSIKIGFPGNVIETGTFSTDNPAIEFNFFDLPNFVTLLQANTITIPAAIVNYKVESYNPVSRVVKITFSGTALTNNLTLSPIKRGAVNAKLN